MARSLKFCVEEEEGLYYPCSENKGADQLRGHREADLRLCFRPSILLVFLSGGSTAVRISRSNNERHHDELRKRLVEKLCQARFNYVIPIFMRHRQTVWLQM